MQFQFITSSKITNNNYDFILLYHKISCYYFNKNEKCKIIDIDNLDNNYFDDILKYNILIDSVILLKNFDNENIFNFLEEIKHNDNKYIILHDIHKHSYGDKYIPKNYSKDKIIICDIINYYYFKKVISLYKCLEYDNIVNILNKNILKLDFYIINFPYDETNFKNYNLNKTQNILFYGNSDINAYYFRYKLKNLIKNIDDVKILDFNNNYNNSICNSELSKEINKSWITIATISKYSYFVRKYMEIASSYSCIAGNINSEGLKVFGNDIIYLSDKYSDRYILGKLNFYLKNKDLIMQKIVNSYKKVLKYNFTNYCDEIISLENKNKYKKTNYYLFITTIDNFSSFCDINNDNFYDYMCENNIIYDEGTKDYEMCIIDSKINFEKFDKILNAIKNKILLVYDLNNIENIILKYDIKNIIFHHNKKENKFLEEKFNLNCHNINHYVDINVFYDMNLDKIYDFFIFLDEKNKLNNKIKKIFDEFNFNMDKFYFKIFTYDKNKKKDKNLNISEIINKSKYTIITDNYLSKKYFETCCSNSIIIGNIEKDKILKDNCIEIFDDMTENNICEILFDCYINYDDKKKILKKYSNMQYLYSQDEYKLKIFDICNEILDK